MTNPILGCLLAVAAAWPSHAFGLEGAPNWWDVLASNRHLQLSLLDQYLEAGDFPENIGHPQERTPYFIDHRGVACAIGHLMLRTGWEREARRVAQSDNHVRIASLTSGKVLDWILISGLTQEETTRIQPSYEFLRQRDLTATRERERVRRHLRGVLAELREQRTRSLFTALDRVLQRKAQDPTFRIELLRPVASRLPDAGKSGKWPMGMRLPFAR